MTGPSIEQAVTSVVAQRVNELRAEAMGQEAPARSTTSTTAILEAAVRRFVVMHGEGAEEIAVPTAAEVLPVLQAECRRWADVRLDGDFVVFEVVTPPSPFESVL